MSGRRQGGCPKTQRSDMRRQAPRVGPSSLDGEVTAHAR